MLNYFNDGKVKENINRTNLLILADFLEANVDDKKFNMHSFRQDVSAYSTTGTMCVSYKSATDCGSIGCAVGWGPFAEGLEAIEEDYIGIPSQTTLNFSRYCERVFGVDSSFELGSVVWALLFSEIWEWVDNSVGGCVKRLRHLSLVLTDEKLLEMREAIENEEEDCDTDEMLIENYVEEYLENVFLIKEDRD